MACDPARGAPPLAGAAGLLFGIPLDVNRADARALEALPGIGPTRADAIVRARDAAPFCRVEELTRVAGLGPVTVARLAPFAAATGAPGCGDS
ncbi:MAG: DNA-binding protein [Proteobacteria bacterium]|nr:MAG: DNA-binding protein [Pseudomonadota bacterium]